MLQVRVEFRDKLNKSIVKRGIFRKQKSFSGRWSVAAAAFLRYSVRYLRLNL